MPLSEGVFTVGTFAVQALFAAPPGGGSLVCGARDAEALTQARRAVGGARGELIASKDTLCQMCDTTVYLHSRVPGLR